MMKLVIQEKSIHLVNEECFVPVPVPMPLPVSASYKYAFWIYRIISGKMKIESISLK
jgi:hypothetical protein